VNGISKKHNNKGLNAMLTTSEVARLLNVHINTVRRWTNRRMLKTYRIGSRGDRRFDREDIASFLEHESEKVRVSRGKAALAIW
jgi:excisionase family DNA binding protein